MLVYQEKFKEKHWFEKVIWYGTNTTPIRQKAGFKMEILLPFLWTRAYHTSDCHNSTKLL